MTFISLLLKYDMKVKTSHATNILNEKIKFNNHAIEDTYSFYCHKKPLKIRALTLETMTVTVYLLYIYAFENTVKSVKR